MHPSRRKLCKLPQNAINPAGGDMKNVREMSVSCKFHSENLMNQNFNHDKLCVQESYTLRWILNTIFLESDV